MKFTYPAVFSKQKDGSYKGYFPDLEGIDVSGETLDLAIRSALDAAYNWIAVELEEDDPQLPMISEIDPSSLAENEVVRQIGVHYRFTEGWEE